MKQKLKILLIDDDTIFCTVVKKRLQNFHEIESISNPYTGLGMLLANDYDCAVIDYEMPELNGLELIKLIRSDARLSETPTVLLTSYAETDIINRALEAGFDAFKLKGDAIQDLNGVISEACGYVISKRQLANEIAIVTKGNRK